MKFNLTLKFDDGKELEITAGSRDQLAWEKTGQNRSVSALLTGMRMQDLYSLAHAAAKRQGLFTGSLKELEESADLEMGHSSKGDESEEVDPTDEDPTQLALSTDH